MDRFKANAIAMNDFLVRKNVYLKTEAAKARIAFANVCNKYGLDLALEFEESVHDEDLLIREMQILQGEAEKDAAHVTGLDPINN